MLIDSVPAGNGTPARTGAKALTSLSQLVGKCQGPLFIALGYRDDELVAAIAARDSTCGQASGDQVADAPHRLGPREVAVRVVQRFQAIEIEHEQRHRQLGDDRAPQERS